MSSQTISNTNDAETLVDCVSTRLRDLAKKNFFGKVTLSFQNGLIHSFKIEETLNRNELLKNRC